MPPSKLSRRSRRFPRFLRTLRRRFSFERLEDRSLLATFTVNTLLDTVDADPGDGVALDASGQTSLRAAVMEANALASDDIINLGPNTYVLTLTGANEDDSRTGDLDIRSNGQLIITGVGAGVTKIDGATLADRVLQLHPEASVQLANLTLQNGNSLLSLPGGGGIFNSADLTISNSAITANLSSQGGGIYNDVPGTITITDSTIVGNGRTATKGGGIYNNGRLTVIGSAINSNSAPSSLGLGGYGGGVYNSPSGQLTIASSTLTDNSVGGYPSLKGGGIYNAGILAVTNSAIVGNSATASVPPPCTVCGVAGDGGGIYNESGIASLTNTTVSANSSASGAIANNAQMTIKNSTIANNFASSPRIGPGGTAGVVNGGTLILQNSIIAQNNSTGFSHDFAGTPTSLGNNLIGSQGTSTGWIESDIVNVDPRIGPLEDNGGPTLTHALLPDSPAIDAGNNVGAPTTDQRGNRRPRDGNGDGVAIVDIGAFEFALGQAGIEAVADAATVNEDTTANVIDVLANDTGPAGSTLIVNAVTQPAHGSATIGQGGNNVVYVPGPNYVGSDSFAYTVSDGTNAATATVNITVVNTDTDLQGSTAGDVFFVRRNPAGTNVEVFDSEEATGIPLLSMPMTSASLLLIESLAGDDRLIIDLAYGNPIPTGGVRFAGGEHVTAGDQLLVRDAGVANGTYLADATTAGSGTVTIGGRNLTFFDVESIDVSRLNSLTVVTPNADDMLSLTNPAAGIGRLTGKSGGVALATLDFSDIANIIIDAAGHDGTAGDDSLDISTVSNLPGNFGFLQYRSGSGENTLAVQSGVVRADATVSPGGVLNTTVASGSHMVTHRFRQSSVTLDENARATILPDGTDAATSVVNDLTINAGATLDLNDNALIINYTGTSALETIRVKIIEGRGGTGIGNGKWNGTGITSGVAQQQSVIQPDTWSVGYAENSALPLGAYSNFRGQPIDATSILIAYTKTGDVNLDGLVNDDDVTIVSATYAPNIAEPDWALGDLDYNGFVDDDDVTLLGALYQPPSPSDLSPPPASTPSSAPSHSTAVHNEFFAAFDTRYAQVRAAKRRLFCTDFDAFQVT